MLSLTTLTVTLLTLATSIVSQTINPNSVDIAMRQQWCTTQEASCPLICLQLPGTTGQPTQNNCDVDTLVFSCVCNNGLQPNASQYSQTIPYFECTTFNSQCVTACAGDSTCAAACQTNHPCGAQNPIRVNLTTTSSTMSVTAAASTAAGSGGYTGFGGSSAAPTGSSDKSAGNNLVLGMGQVYGLGAIFVGFFGGFAFVL
ncbi:hypothetical protein MMC14_006687 [Varicellaria rhodocarpa]|nr:hypothetical protein [Varicellaria rhodocarpa]